MKRRHLLQAAGVTTAAIGLNTGLNAIAATPLPAKKPEILTATVTLDKGLSGYYATPKGKGLFPAVIVIMEAYGLNAYIKDVCNRLAQAGYATLAPDFYRGALFPYTDTNGAIAKLKTMKDEVAMADFGKALEFLAKQKEVQTGGVGVMGFCMGGRYTFLANAVHATKIRAAVAFYGAGIAPLQSPNPLGQVSLLDKVAVMQAPIMLMYGSEDVLIAADEQARIAAALSAAKKRYTINLFPKAQHGFLSDRRENYEPSAAKESWEMTLAFFRRHLKTA